MEETNAVTQELEQLRLRVHDLNDFIEQGSLPLHWVDRNGIITWANKAELDLLGYTNSEYVGQPISHFHADKDVIGDILRRLLIDETLNNYPASLIAKDGSIKQVLINSNVKRQNGEFIHTRCFTRDVTQIKRAEESNALLAAIVDSSDHAIISKNLESLITSWNDAAEKLFGYSAQEMIGESILKLIPQDRQDEESWILDKLKTGDRIKLFETKRLTKSGLLIDVSVTISPVKDTQGNIIGLSKIARDITEKKHEDVRKNDFIAMVSHELKTPLTSMKSYLQVLLAMAKKEGSSFQLHALTRAEVQAQKMTVMINDFLNLARLEEGKIELTKTVFELYPLMEEICGEALFLTSNHRVQLLEGQLVDVDADRDKIGQVLNNLLSNAIKYSPKGGDITLGYEIAGSKVKVFVKDEGVGISKADQKLLFHRFYRVKNERVSNVSGFGIGLYLVSEILRYHGTRIDVESSPNSGSTFYFLLDCAGPPASN